MIRLKNRILIIAIFGIFFSSSQAQSISEIGCNGDLINCTFIDDSLNLFYASCVTFNSDGSKSSTIEKWDGSLWQEIASAINGEVKTMIKMNGNLIIAGSFMSINGNPIYNIAEWNDTSWNALGLDGLGTFDCTINSLCEFNGNLIAGGDFGVNAVNNLFLWNDTSWLPFNQFVNGKVLSICNFNNTLYICGDIEYIDTLKIHGIARYADSSWTNLSDSIDGTIYNMILYSGQLYFSGLFVCMGDSSSEIIASYDGSAINNLRNGITAFVTAMHVYNNELYVAGDFIDTSGTNMQKIVSWNGTNWDQSSYDFNDFSLLTSISHFGNSLIVTGHINDENNIIRNISEFEQQ